MGLPAEYQPGDLAMMQPTVGEALMRSLGLKGNLPQLIDPRVQAGITSLDLTAEEFAFARRSLLTSYRLAVAANAGFPSQAQLIVAGSGAATLGAQRAMIRIKQLIISNPNAAAQTLQIGLVTTQAAGIAFVSGGAQRDDRLRAVVANPTGLGYGLFGVVNGVAAVAMPAAGALVITVSAGGVVVLPVEFILTGLSLFTVITGVNQALECQAVCEERALLTEES